MVSLIPDLSKLDNAAKLRKSLYGLAVAVGGVLIINGITTDAETDAYMLVAEALLGLAFYNTSSNNSSSAEEPLETGVPSDGN